MTLDEFRILLGAADEDWIVDEIILSDGAVALSTECVDLVRTRLSAAYNVFIDEVAVFVVGSAKLGFSLVEKDRRDRPRLPRYRPFGPESDVDIAVVSRSIFHKIWLEIGRHAHTSEKFPLDTKLSRYLTYGWLRPDKFPDDLASPLCRLWWKMFSAFSADTRFGRRKVRGGLYYDRSFLQMYQRRAVRDCIAAEELKK